MSSWTDPLGTPAEGPEAAWKGRNAEMARIYPGQLELPEALAQAAELRALVAEKPSALLCSEPEAGHCHRALLAEAMPVDAEPVDLMPGSPA